MRSVLSEISVIVSFAKLSPAQFQLSFSFAGLRLALFLINPPTHPSPPTHESSEQAEKCVAKVKFQFFGHRLALVSAIYPLTNLFRLNFINLTTLLSLTINL